MILSPAILSFRIWTRSLFCMNLNLLSILYPEDMWMVWNQECEIYIFLCICFIHSYLKRNLPRQDLGLAVESITFTHIKQDYIPRRKHLSSLNIWTETLQRWDYCSIYTLHNSDDHWHLMTIWASCMPVRAGRRMWQENEPLIAFWLKP